jgi:hypothetical protein
MSGTIIAFRRLIREAWASRVMRPSGTRHIGRVADASQELVQVSVNESPVERPGCASRRREGTQTAQLPVQQWPSGNVGRVPRSTANQPRPVWIVQGRAVLRLTAWLATRRPFAAFLAYAFGAGSLTGWQDRSFAVRG